MSPVDHVDAPITRRSLILMSSLMAASLLPTVIYLAFASSGLGSDSKAALLPLSLALSPILILPLRSGRRYMG
jgi:hypothetical protein